MSSPSNYTRSPVNYSTYTVLYKNADVSRPHVVTTDGCLLLRKMPNVNDADLKGSGNPHSVSTTTSPTGSHVMLPSKQSSTRVDSSTTSELKQPRTTHADVGQPFVVQHLTTERNYRSDEESTQLTASHSFSLTRLEKSKLRSRLVLPTLSSVDDALQLDHQYIGPLLTDVRLTTTQEVYKLICSVPGKSSPLDKITSSVTNQDMRCDICAADLSTNHTVVLPRQVSQLLHACVCYAAVEETRT